MRQLQSNTSKETKSGVANEGAKSVLKKNEFSQACQEAMLFGVSRTCMATKRSLFP